MTMRNDMTKPAGTSPARRAFGGPAAKGRAMWPAPATCGAMGHGVAPEPAGHADVLAARTGSLEVPI